MTDQRCPVRPMYPLSFVHPAIALCTLQLSWISKQSTVMGQYTCMYKVGLLFTCTYPQLDVFLQVIQDNCMQYPVLVEEFAVDISGES